MSNTFQVKAQVGSFTLVADRIDLILCEYHCQLFSKPIYKITDWYSTVPALRGDLWVKLNNVWGRDITSMSDEEFATILGDVGMMARVEGCLFAVQWSWFFNAIDPRPSDQDLIDWLAGKLGQPLLDRKYRKRDNAFLSKTQEHFAQGTLLNRYLGMYLWKTAESLFSDLPIEVAARAAAGHMAMEFNRDRTTPLTVETLIADAQEGGSNRATPTSFDDDDLVDAYTSRVDGLEPITEDIFPTQ